MPSKFRLRKPFAPVVKAIAKVLIKIGITPNMATFLMLICAITSVLILNLADNLWLFGIFIFITGIMDGVDGAIARLTGKGSKFGAFLDSTMDRISEMVIYIGLIFVIDRLFVFSFNTSLVFIWLTLLGSYLVSYTRARIEALGAEIGVKYDTNIGLFARSERLFYLFLSSLISALIDIVQGYGLTLSAGSTVGKILFTWLFVAFSILVFGTFIYRLLTYKKYLDETDSKLKNTAPN